MAQTSKTRRTIRLPKEFLEAIQSLKAGGEGRKGMTWREMRLHLLVDDSTYNDLWSKPEGGVEPAGDIFTVLRVCFAFQRVLNQVPSSLGFSEESVASLKGFFERDGVPEQILEAFHRADRDKKDGKPPVTERDVRGWYNAMFPASKLGPLSAGFPDPPDPERFIARDKELAACRGLLLGSTAGAVAIRSPHAVRDCIALRGMGGAGKSVLARVLGHDPAIRCHFNDGIIWLDIGQERSGTKERRLEIQSELARKLGVTLDFASVNNAWPQLLNSLVVQTRLVICDDVWNAKDVEWLDFRYQRSRVLITTRDGYVVQTMRATEYPLETLTEPQALELLGKWSGKSTAGDDQATTVAKLCGYLPLAIAISGAWGADLAWSAIAEGLRSADLSFLELPGQEDRDKNVLRSIQASIDFLKRSPTQADRDAVDYYSMLAAFPPDITVPLDIVNLLWAERTGWTLPRSEQAIQLLKKRSLLEITTAGHVALHEVHHKYLRYTQPNWKQWNDHLLAAYSKRRGEKLAWSEVASDGYIHQHLVHHFKTAGRWSEVRDLLFDCAWLEAKLRATDITQLLADFAEFVDERFLPQVGDALRLSAHHLSRDPSLLRNQLHGRLLRTPALRELQRAGSRPNQSAWLRCLSPSLSAPGRALLSSVRQTDTLIKEIAISADGTSAVSAALDGSLRYWDIGSGTTRDFQIDGGQVTTVAISADGSRFVAGFLDGALEVRDRSGQVRELGRHGDRVTTVAVSASATRAVSASLDGRLKFWDLASGCVRDVRGFSAEVTAMALSADGARGLGASQDGMLKLWDFDTEISHDLTGRGRGVAAVAISPDGTRAVSAWIDQGLTIWNLRSREGHELPGFRATVTSVALSHDSTRALVGSIDGALQALDLESGGLRNVARMSPGVISVAACSDGHRAITATIDGTLESWDLDSDAPGRDGRWHAGAVIAVAVSPDGKRAVSASVDGIVKVWELGPDEVRDVVEVAVTGTNDSPPLRLVIDSSLKLVTVGPLSGIDRWAPEHGEVVLCLSLTADGAGTFILLSDGTLKYLDFGSGSVSNFPDQFGEIRAASLSADTARAVTLSSRLALGTWERGSYRELGSEFDGAEFSCVAVSGDGRRAVSGSLSGRLVIWDLNENKSVHEVPNPRGRVTATGIAVDGARGVSGSVDGTMKVWDLVSGSVSEFRGHDGEVTSVAVCTDSTRAVSTSTDRTLRLWDLLEGEILASFGADSWLTCCGCSAHGDTIAVGDSLGRVHVLRLQDA